VLYPGEDHHFLGEGAPSVRADAAQRIIDWVSTHIQRAPPPLTAEQGEAVPSSSAQG
jgi:hypothetical protein